MSPSTASPKKPLTRKAIPSRPWLLVILGLIVITQIVALTPSTLEQAAGNWEDANQFVGDPATENETLATGVPQGQLPEYSIDGFDYVSTSQGAKQWKLIANRASMYQNERLVHARQITAYIFDRTDRVTVVHGREAKYFVGQRDLEIFGQVVTRFPDGFELKSDYIRYSPDRHKVEIPLKWKVSGASGGSTDQSQLGFESHGLDLNISNGVITLPSEVQITVSQTRPQKTLGRQENSADASDSQNRDAVTTITSDHCEINRSAKSISFGMNPHPAASQVTHVKISQKSLYAHGRRAEVKYGSNSPNSNELQLITLIDDVMVQEKSGTPDLRYATAGRADFSASKNTITLREYPQVYHGQDTVTGDVIIVHRDTDSVEVEYSNAFSSGKR